MRKIPLLILILLIATTYTCYARESKATKTIAIMPFENSTGKLEYSPLKEGLADILTMQMGKMENISVVDREHLNKILDEQKLTLKGVLGEKEAIEVGKLIGANMMLLGGFTLSGDVFKINSHLYNVETTQLIKSEEARGKISEIIELVHKLVMKLADDLDIKIAELKPGEIDKSPEVNLHFIRGLGYYYGCMYDYAIMEFMNTLKLNPEHADARFWNAKSYFVQKEWSHTRIELDRFLEEFPKDPRVKEVKKMNKTCWQNMKDWERELFESSKREKEQ